MFVVLEVVLVELECELESCYVLCCFYCSDGFEKMKVNGWVDCGYQCCQIDEGWFCNGVELGELWVKMIGQVEFCCYFCEFRKVDVDLGKECEEDEFECDVEYGVDYVEQCCFQQDQVVQLVWVDVECCYDVEFFGLFEY